VLARLAGPQAARPYAPRVLRAVVDCCADDQARLNDDVEALEAHRLGNMRPTRDAITAVTTDVERAAVITVRPTDAPPGRIARSAVQPVQVQHDHRVPRTGLEIRDHPLVRRAALA